MLNVLRKTIMHYASQNQAQGVQSFSVSILSILVEKFFFFYSFCYRSACLTFLTYHYLDIHNTYQKLLIQPLFSTPITEGSLLKFHFKLKKHEKKYQPFVLQKLYPLRKILYHQSMQNKGSNDQRLSVFQSQILTFTRDMQIFVDWKLNNYDLMNQMIYQRPLQIKNVRLFSVLVSFLISDINLMLSL